MNWFVPHLPGFRFRPAQNLTPRLFQFVILRSGRNGQLFQETYANKIYGQEMSGKFYSAIQITTAASICTVLDLLMSNEIPTQGFVRQEEIGLETFLQNRFGRYYRTDKSLNLAA